MSHYKLIYFNMRARGEFIRLIFAASGVKYEDHRIERDQWPALKPTMPFYQIPILEVDGVRLCQSSAIGRYLAGKFGLAGNSDMEKARADMIVDCFADAMGTAYRDYVFAKDDVTRAEHARSFAEEKLPDSLLALERILTDNNGGDGYFVGSQLTWADVRLVHFADSLKTMQIDSSLDKYPKLSALRQRVAELPRIKEWLTNRPQTAY